MSPVSAQKRQAARVLMDFLDQGWADKLGLKATEAGGCGEPGQHWPGGYIRRASVYCRRTWCGFLWDRALCAPERWGSRLRAALMGASSCGSSIYFAFRSEDRDRIRQAIEQVNAGRVRVEERGIFYSSLRAGPAGKWTGDYLGSAPAPASGLVAYGPYIDLEPGQYRLSYRVKLATAERGRRLRIRLGVTANFGKMLAPERSLAHS